MPRWMPDWSRMMVEAREISLDAPDGYVYVIADSHLGDARAPAGEFFDMLGRLPQARMVVFLGDLFQVWLGLPKFWGPRERCLLGGFERLRQSGVSILFIVGNREFFLPRRPERAARLGLPFDHVVYGACILRWAGRRFGFTHGDTINRLDTPHLKWRRFSRGWLFEAMFHLMPGPVARAVSEWIERTAASTNRAIKVQFPHGEIREFADTVMGDLDGFMVGHFHRDLAFTPPGRRGEFRIVPDWHSKKALLRLEPGGGCTRLVFSPADRSLEPREPEGEPQGEQPVTGGVSTPP
ncbi:MAG: metallophosphoesterase [bacterium]